jgi:hypothetical protein
MPSLSQIAQNSATVTVQWGGLDWTIEYRPGTLTDANLALIDGGFDQNNQAIVAIVKSWDITESDGVTPFPLDVARLPEVPYMLKVAILRGVVRDARPN